MMHEIEGYDNHEDVKSLVSHAIVPVSTGSSDIIAAGSRISHGLYNTDKGLYRQAKQAFTGRVRLKL